MPKDFNYRGKTNEELQAMSMDEFIRLLESNESKAPSQEQRLSMLHKVAELWITQKGRWSTAIIRWPPVKCYVIKILKRLVTARTDNILPSYLYHL